MSSLKQSSFQASAQFVDPCVVDVQHPREVMEQGVTALGLPYRVVALDKHDIPAIVGLYDAESTNPQNAGKHFLLPRTPDKIAKMFDNGTVFGVLVGSHYDYLGAMAAVTMIADPEDAGRGHAYEDGRPNSNRHQVYFKSALVHPEYQKKSAEGIGHGLIAKPYPHRLLAALTMRGKDDATLDTFVIKSNNPIVLAGYQKLGWKEKAQYPLPEYGDIDRDALSEEEAKKLDKVKTLYTYVLTAQQAMASLYTKQRALFDKNKDDMIAVHGNNEVDGAIRFAEHLLSPHGAQDTAAPSSALSKPSIN